MEEEEAEGEGKATGGGGGRGGTLIRGEISRTLRVNRFISPVDSVLRDRAGCLFVSLPSRFFFPAPSSLVALGPTFSVAVSLRIIFSYFASRRKSITRRYGAILNLPIMRKETPDGVQCNAPV